jgi:hypothetical protein
VARRRGASELKAAVIALGVRDEHGKNVALSNGSAKTVSIELLILPDTFRHI